MTSHLRFRARALLVCLASLLAAHALFGCARDEQAPLATVAIGSNGGVLSAPGIALGVPEGALGTVREISVFEAEAPPGLDNLLTPVFRFEPSGTVFEQPVVVNFDVPDGAVGQVIWTREGSHTVFERVGYAFEGRGRAWITHFSEGAVQGSCTPSVPVQDCECLGQDMMGGALCSNPPPDECVTSYRGFPEGSCTGYGERPEYTVRCYCADTAGHSMLCPVPLDSSGGCPGGARLYSGRDMDSCTGYYRGDTPNGDGVYPSEFAPGTLHSCLTVEEGTVWRLVPGRLDNCRALMGQPTEPSPEMWSPPMGGAASGPSTPILEEPTTESPTQFECADTDIDINMPPPPPPPPAMDPPPMSPPPPPPMETPPPPPMIPPVPPGMDPPEM